MRWQTVAVVGVLSLSVGWLLGGQYPVVGRPAFTAPGPASSAPRPLGVAPSVNLAPAAAQARAPRSQAGAPRPMRNPFAFARPSVTAGRAAAAAAVPEPEPDVASADPAEVVSGDQGPLLRLAGMAQTETPNGPELTAMVHDGQGLQYVRLGDALPGGYTVVDVQETAVTIRDGSGGERTLRLP